MGKSNRFGGLVISILIMIELLQYSPVAFATAQIPDEIVVDNVAYRLHASPLNGAPKYLIDQVDKVKLGFCTASWRGYKAYWEIRSNKLLLKGIQGNPCNDKSAIIPASKLAGKEIDADLLIEAEWFSGELSIAQGDLVEYVHGGYGSKYEKYLVLNINNGTVVSKLQHDAREEKLREEEQIMSFIEKARVNGFKDKGAEFWKLIAIPLYEDYGTDIASLQRYIQDLSNANESNCLMASMIYVSDGYLCRSLYQENEDKIKLLREAAALGHPVAMNELAMTLHKQGNPEHSPEIKSLMTSAANKGIPHAQISVGYWSMTGKHGFAINYKEAMKWNMEAYKQGHSEGANNIGELYENGLGVVRDIEKAKEWYKKASSLGNKEATERLRKTITNRSIISNY